MPPSPLKRVFVSYSHDSAEHKAQVLDFSRFLTENGLDVHVDQWYLDQRRDWYTWALENIEKADYVVVVASTPYRLAADGRAPAGENRGLQSEAAALRDWLHSERPEWTRRILPVLLPGHDVSEIPRFLQPGTADRFTVTDFTVAGCEDLLRVLTDQPPHIRPEPGETPFLGTRSPGPKASTPPPAARETRAPARNVQNVTSRGGGITIVNQGGNQTVHRP